LLPAGPVMLFTSTLSRKSRPLMAVLSTLKAALLLANDFAPNMLTLLK
jgi:hypothetical protein